MPNGESLEDWEVTEAELDGGLVQVVCASEQHNFSSSLQMEKGDDLYQRVYQVLRVCMDMPKYRPKVTVAIGKRGPGGGLVFHIDGPKAYEVSEVLGRYETRIRGLSAECRVYEVSGVLGTRSWVWGSHASLPSSRVSLSRRSPAVFVTRIGKTSVFPKIYDFPKCARASLSSQILRSKIESGFAASSAWK